MTVAKTITIAGKTEKAQRNWFQRWSTRAIYLGVFIGICQYLNSINVSPISIVLLCDTMLTHTRTDSTTFHPRSLTNVSSHPSNTQLLAQMEEIRHSSSTP